MDRKASPIFERTKVLVPPPPHRQQISINIHDIDIKHYLEIYTLSKKILIYSPYLLYFPNFCQIKYHTCIHNKNLENRKCDWFASDEMNHESYYDNTLWILLWNHCSRISTLKGGGRRRGSVIIWRMFWDNLRHPKIKLPKYTQKFPELSYEFVICHIIFVQCFHSYQGYSKSKYTSCWKPP